MRREDEVALVAVALHLEHPAPAACAHEAEHAALIDNLQGLDEVRVEEEVQGAQLLVAGAGLGGQLAEELVSHLLHGDLHRSIYGLS